MDGTPSNSQAWLDWAQSSRDDGGLGLAPHQAAGLVGNLQAESGKDLTPWGPTGDNGTAWGTAQWRGDRLAGLKDLAAKNGQDYRSIEAQQAWMRHELDTTENGAYKALQSAGSPEEAARIWDQHYERSDGNSRAQRMANARAIMDGNLGGGSPDSGGALSYASTGKGPSSVPALSPDNTMGPGALSPQPQDPWDRRAEGLSQIGAALAGIVNPAQAAAINASINADHTDANTKNQQALMTKVYAQRMAKDAEGSWTSHVMPDGQVMQSNTNGQTRMLGGNFAKDGGGTEQAPQMIPTWGDASKLGTDPTKITPDQEAAYYASMNPQQAAMVQGLVENTLAPPTAAAMSRKDSPYPAAFAAAKRLDPSLDSTTYGARINGQKDWATKGAESARALNQTIAHQSDVLVGAMKGLNNGDTPIWNSVKNMWDEKVGGHDSVPVFRTAAHAVVDELAKTFKQNNLSDTEIRKWEENLPADMSPEQQRGQIAAFRKLMHGSMESLEGKREQQLGKRAASKLPPLLTEAGQNGLGALDAFVNEKPAAAAPAAPAAPKDTRPPLSTFF